MENLEYYIDVEDGLKRIFNNKAIYKKLLGKFTEKSGFEELKAELAAGDIVSATRSAHSIKGAGANLSLIKATEVAAALEQDLKNGLPHEEHFHELEEVMAATLGYIQTLVETL